MPPKGGNTNFSNLLIITENKDKALPRTFSGTLLLDYFQKDVYDPHNTF